jgi:phosphoadenosine phosphosulfate reductase
MSDWHQQRRDRAKRRAAEFAQEHGHLAGVDLLRAAIDGPFAGEIAIASSFGAEAVALLALAAEVDPATPVIFLDTGKLFDETLAYRDLVVERLGLTGIRSVGPDIVDIAATDPGGQLWRTNPDACCFLRKVTPMVQALTPYAAWVTGRKRFHGGDRRHLPPVEAADGWVKINPLADWTRRDVFQFIARRGLPKHPLLERHYVSIGCAPCTKPVTSADGDIRDGRWSGQAKAECGIHLAAPARSLSPAAQAADIAHESG